MESKQERAYGWYLLGKVPKNALLYKFLSIPRYVSKVLLERRKTVNFFVLYITPSSRDVIFYPVCAHTGAKINPKVSATPLHIQYGGPSCDFLICRKKRGCKCPNMAVSKSLLEESHWELALLNLSQSSAVAGGRSSADSRVG